MINILFVCTGNICRSPAAEAILKKKVDEEGLSEKIHVESAGTTSWHVGEKADHRMIHFGKEYGYDLQSIAEAFTEAYFPVFDWIFVATKDHMEELSLKARSDKDLEKICLMSKFSKKYSNQEVPDPYYQGDQGFIEVYDMLEECCSEMLKALKKSL